MASTFDRGRRPGSLRRKQPRETANSSRVTLPLSATLLQSSLTGAVLRAAVEFNLVDYIFDRLNEGTIDKVEKTEVRENGFDLDVKVDGKWYHISVFFTPKGEYSA